MTRHLILHYLWVKMGQIYSSRPARYCWPEIVGTFCFVQGTLFMGELRGDTKSKITFIRFLAQYLYCSWGWKIPLIEMNVVRSICIFFKIKKHTLKTCYYLLAKSELHFSFWANFVDIKYTYTMYILCFYPFNIYINYFKKYFTLVTNLTCNKN